MRTPPSIEAANRGQIIGRMGAARMELITWNESFSVGVRQFDEQHKELVRMLNQLIVDPEAGTRSETISELLSAMTNYAEVHFEAEEVLMEQYGYPQLDEHTAQHDAFRRKTAELCIETMNRIGTVPESLLQYLRDWLIEHILQSDMTYKPFFRELGVG
jgi:hemerythrin